MTAPAETITTPARSPAARRLLPRGLFLGAALLLLFFAYLSGWPPAVTAVDVEQGRLNRPLPPPAGATLWQTFKAEHDGLSEVEVLVARSGLEGGTTGSLQLELQDAVGAVIASERWSVSSLRHNQPLRLAFSPQPHSAGRSYTLVLTDEGQNPFSVWGYDLDVYDGGQLGGPAWEGAVQEMRFLTRYQLLPGAALLRLTRMIAQNLALLVVALLLLFMPGSLLLLLLRARLPRWDRGAWWGVALALGIAIWPLLWFWLTLAGGRWSSALLALVLAGGWLAALWRARQPIQEWLRALPSRLTSAPVATGGRADHLLLLLILLIALSVRLLAVRDLAFPPWVDASRHALITAVMAVDGQVLTDYQPFLPVTRFPYHFGFHTLPASLYLLGGWPLPDLLLILGQLLNALAPLTLYAAAWLLTRRRGVGLIAAFLVALPFFFPAYYATWGRLTQLTGVLLLPVLLALTWQLLHGARRRGGLTWLLVGLLAAGLALIHFRVFLLYLPFAALAWLAALGRRSWALAAAALTALLLVGPRFWQLWQLAAPMNITSPAAAGYNDFPTAYLSVGWERAFLLAAALAWMGALLGALRPSSRRRWAILALVLVAWPALVMLLLSGRLLALPSTWLINLNSAYIVFFIPLSLLLAIAAGRLLRWLAGRSLIWRGVAYLVTGILIGALFLFGVQQQLTILNPTTLLARQADRAGLTWAYEHLPAQATVAVSSWQWLGQTWAGSDGGAWLLPLSASAGNPLQTTTPPVDYIYNPDLFRQVRAFNRKAASVEDWADPTAAQWLRDQGVTHVYVGARGGFFDPSDLARNPSLEMLYQSGGVFIFAVKQFITQGVMNFAPPADAVIIASVGDFSSKQARVTSHARFFPYR